MSPLEAFGVKRHELTIFMDGVVAFIGQHPKLNAPPHPIVHSSKKRLKEEAHLTDKILRKNAEGVYIDESNLFSEITDLAGVRILHLFQRDFGAIDEVIRERISNGDWVLAEKPKAYTWDPESEGYFAQFDLEVLRKDSFYTSVHYLVRPRADSPICCEVQVRTLFEEIWGEVDHRMNYPVPTDKIACVEQIKVLSKVVGAGSRLLDALQRVYAADS